MRAAWSSRTSSGCRTSSIFRWDEREVNDRLGRIMRNAFREVSARADDDDVSLRTAAYELGIERVVEAARTRGYIS